MKYFSISIFILLLTVRCRENSTEYVLPYSGDKLVLNGVLVADSLMKFNISRTFPASGEVPKVTKLEDCKVEIFENGMLIETILESENGNYHSNYPSLPGQEYQIVVSHKGFTSVSTNAIKVPERVPYLTINTEKTVDGIINTNIKQWRVITEMEEYENNKNTTLYFQSFRTIFNSEPNAISQFWEKSNLNSIVQNECFLRYDLYLPDKINTKILSNDCFVENKSQNEYYVEVERNKVINEAPLQIAKESASKVELIYGVASREFYEFVKVENRQPGNIGRLWKEPVTTYTNVFGGYGVVYALNFKKELIQ